MALSSIEAYDLVRFADQLQARLAKAQEELAQKRALKSEKEWLAAAATLLQAAREPTSGLLEKVRGLPELAEVRDEYAAEFQNQWVDTLERLVAGFTFHGGNRDPIIEALYPHQKFPALRKADRDTVHEYVQELERRQKTAYVSRQLASPAYAFALPVLEMINAAYAKWQTAFVGEGMAEDQAADLRKELTTGAKKLDVALKQAKLLAEAALTPVPGMFEEMGLAAKPKKRTPKAARPAADAKAGPAEVPAEDATAPKLAAEEPAQQAPEKVGAAPAPAPEAAPKAEAKPKKKKAANGAEAAK